jgi:hypothetical protein
LRRTKISIAMGSLPMIKFSIHAASAILIALASPALAIEPGVRSQFSDHAGPFVLVAAPATSKADLARLVGQSVRTVGGIKIGNIEGISVNRDGSVKQVIVGVGDYLGIGDHDVALGWDSLHFSHNGQEIDVRVSKHDLKAMPKYEYANPSLRGTVFADAG